MLTDIEVDNREEWLLEPLIEVAAELNAVSGWTWEHSGRVARFALELGRKLQMNRNDLLALHCGALLHDVGKMLLPEGLLNKKEKLTRDEWYEITKHPMNSALIIRAQALSALVAGIAQSHHEWYNGQGYPLGVTGSSIPLGARILSLADACDAMSSDRPYRPALQPEQIVSELAKGAGTQFDPVLVHKLGPLLQGDHGVHTAGQRLRLISTDVSIIRQIWFALYPQGWDIEIYPLETTQGTFKPAADPTSAVNSQPFLTIIDTKSAGPLAHHAVGVPAERCLWIDPEVDSYPALHTPLDLEQVLKQVQLLTSAGAAHTGIRVLLADPFHLFRQALRECLSDYGDIHVVAEVSTADGLRRARAANEHDIEVVTSDLFGSPGAGHTVQTPGGNSGPPIVPAIVLVADEELDDPAVMSRVREQGTMLSTEAYIHRGANVEIVVEAIRLLASQAS
ncbi:MAG: HD domain-containing phosphohydrolase [Chloroflexota bacterium]